MSTLMDKAIESLRHDVPSEHQDDVARMVMNLTGRQTRPYHLTEEEAADLDEADAEIARGELASDDDLRAIWAKHGA